MDLQIYGEHLEVTPALKAHAEEKCNKFKSLVGNSVVNIRLKVDEKKQSQVKLDLHHNGHDVHIDTSNKDMYASITEAANKAHTIISQNHKKAKNHHATSH